MLFVSMSVIGRHRVETPWRHLSQQYPPPSQFTSPRLGSVLTNSNSQKLRGRGSNPRAMACLDPLRFRALRGLVSTGVAYILYTYIYIYMYNRIYIYIYIYIHVSFAYRAHRAFMQTAPYLIDFGLARRHPGGTSLPGPASITVIITIAIIIFISISITIIVTITNDSIIISINTRRTKRHGCDALSACRACYDMSWRERLARSDGGARSRIVRQTIVLKRGSLYWSGIVRTACIVRPCIEYPWCYSAPCTCCTI